MKVYDEVKSISQVLHEVDEKRSTNFKKWNDWYSEIKDLTDEYDLNEGKREQKEVERHLNESKRSKNEDERQQGEKQRKEGFENLVLQMKDIQIQMLKKENSGMPFNLGTQIPQPVQFMQQSPSVEILQFKQDEAEREKNENQRVQEERFRQEVEKKRN
jgi:hypothetical protein